MFSRARIRLTLLYTAVFLACFWAFSIGLYAWTERSFEVEVGEKMMQRPALKGAGADLGEIVVDINETALDELKSGLIALNLLLLLIIPALSWLLTGKALEPVRKAHEMQRQFVSDAAHELRTPLTILQGEMEMALNMERTPEDYRAVLTSGRQEILRLSDLAERLLFLARHDDSNDRLVFECIDLTDLVSAVLAAHRAPFAAKNLALAFHPPEESVAVEGDQQMLSRLFANLVDNAVKYTAGAGHIAVTIAADEARAMVEIADTGIGIAPDLHEKIFARFTRADASRSETKGYGLGLAICRAIAERHGGAIAVASSLGLGSTFTVTLPRAQSR